MIHGLNNTFLYSAKKIIARWSNGHDNVEVRGTGFFIDKDGELIFVTNRHIVEPGHADAKYSGFEIVEMKLGKR